LISVIACAEQALMRSHVSQQNKRSAQAYKKALFFLYTGFAFACYRGKRCSFAILFGETEAIFLRSEDE
jgi:hypothetical protein